LLLFIPIVVFAQAEHIIYIAVQPQCLYNQCVQQEAGPIIRPTHSIEEPPQLGGILCECVRYARSLGVEIPYNLHAIGLQPNSPPVENGLALFRYKNFYHVGVITLLEETGFWIIEANYKKCKVTERFIYYDDPALRGFYISP